MSEKIGRRRFLKACAALGAGAAVGGAAQLLFEVVRISPSLQRVVGRRTAMGTFVTMTAAHPSRSAAEEAIGRAFDEIERLEALLTRYRPSSPVYVLNRDGRLEGPPPEVLDVVRRALDVHRLTGGAFDITVKPVLDLFARGTLPSDEEIREVRPLVDASAVEATPGRIRLARSGMGITLDGVAKGYIVDHAGQILGRCGSESHLVVAGGDIRARGGPWKVAIQDPWKRGDCPDAVELRDGAIATSGSYEIYYDPERRFHHVVDPHTARSPQGSVSATVRAATATEADALATSVLTLGPRSGRALIDGLPGRSCFVIGSGGETYRSAAWESAG